uniref:SGNH hydrolase-type esterase domain-containing protein n=1 Tax=Eptatretus burgeri TaxID=7764 RepID=A0A8C4QGC4_EPTBU
MVKVFVADEMMKYVDSSFCRKDCRHRILCSFEGAGVRDIEGRVNNIVSGHGRKKLLVVHLGVNDVGKVYSEVLKNRHRILGKWLKAKGGEVIFSGILPRLGNIIEIMSRAIDFNQWLEDWVSGGRFYIEERGRKQRVAVSGRMSCWGDVSRGVPQASVLGP